MRALLVLCATFGLIGSYLEFNQPAETATVAPAPAQVVRDSAPVAATTAATVATTTRPEKQAKHRPLNLQLPVQQSSATQQIDSAQGSLSNLFDYQGKQKVSYNAELVFDRTKGEDITGGKVHIKIPLS